VSALHQRGPKQKRSVDRVRWVIDHDARARGEPGLIHSFVGSLATAIDCAGYVVDPSWLMGSTGFAFRIWVEDRLLPSAMNSFDWEEELTGAVHRAGFGCTYIDAASDAGPAAAVRRHAHEAILASIDRGVPAIAWDLNDPPMWGLIVGYNDHIETYETLSSWHYRMPLRYDRLGRRDVQRLSVLVLEDARADDETDILRQSLQAAVDHARGRADNPYSRIHTGLEGYKHWAAALEPGTLADHELQFADYYAEMYSSFRCYARDYLAQWDDVRLKDAGLAYARCADQLGTLLRLMQTHKQHPAPIREQAAACVLTAAAEEERAVVRIEAYLANINAEPPR